MTQTFGFGSNLPRLNQIWGCEEMWYFQANENGKSHDHHQYWYDSYMACWRVVHPWNLTEPLKIGNPKRKLIFQPSFFRGYCIITVFCFRCTWSSKFILRIHRIISVSHVISLPWIPHLKPHLNRSCWQMERFLGGNQSFWQYLFAGFC